MRLSKRLFIFSFFALLFVCSTPVWAISVGEPAPGFTLQTLDGKTVSLGDFKGQVVLLKLGTTWCPTCKLLANEIGKAGGFLKENNAVVLDVFVQDTADMVGRYLEDKSYPMPYHCLIDDGQVYRAYNIYLIPRLVVVDPAGVVTYDSAGQNVTADQLQELVMAAQPAPKAAVAPVKE